MRDMVKLGLRLMLFAMVAGLLLAVVNEITKEPIAQNLLNKQNEARQAVIGDYDFVKLDVELADYPLVTGVYSATKDGELEGYVYEISSRGYAGEVLFAVGVSARGHVTGVSVTAHSETKGLGTAKEEKFLGQFKNARASEDMAMSADAITGATTSSMAIKNGLAEALRHAEHELGVEPIALEQETFNLYSALGYPEIEHVTLKDGIYQFTFTDGRYCGIPKSGETTAGEIATAREFFEHYLKEGN